MLYVLHMRKIIFNIFIILFSVFLGVSFAGDVPKYDQAKAEFYVLKAQWDKEIPSYSSNTNDYWKEKAAKAILNMGKRALPFIFDEIQNGNFFFNIAAERITQIDFKTQASDSEQKQSELWINWWHENKSNPEWNLFLN